MCVPTVTPGSSMPSHAVIFGKPEIVGVYSLIASQRSLSVVLGPELPSRSSIDGVFGKAGRRVSLAMRIRRMSTGAKRSSVEMPTMSEANDATTPPQPQACTRSRQMSTDV